MNAVTASELIKKYAYCQECGNGKVGNGEGSLEITEDMFIRTCKCGWSIEIKSKGGR